MYVYTVMSVCLLCCVPFSSSVQVGSCKVDTNELAPMPNFRMNLVEGTWYKYGVYTSKGKPKASCMRFTFIQPMPGAITMKITDDKEHTRDVKMSVELAGVYTTESTAAKRVTESEEDSEMTNKETRGIFLFVDTDYDCWVVSYWCEDKAPEPPVNYMYVFLRNNSDACVKAKSKNNYKTIITQFTDITLGNLKWNDKITDCKMEPKEEKQKESDNVKTKSENTKQEEKKREKTQEEKTTRGAENKKEKEKKVEVDAKESKAKKPETEQGKVKDTEVETQDGNEQEGKKAKTKESEPTKVQASKSETKTKEPETKDEKSEKQNPVTTADGSKKKRVAKKQ